MKPRRLSLFALSVVVLLTADISVHATTITGQANIAGSATVQGGDIIFAPTFANAAGGIQTGDFAGLTGGTIQSLTGGPITGTLPIPIAGFVNFTTGLAAPIIFDLTSIPAGVGTAAGCSSSASGLPCTPAGSPFTLFQLTGNTVLAVIQFNGISYIGSSTSGSSPTTAIFSTQTAINGTVPDLINRIASGGAISGVLYSGSFAATPSTTTPEPVPLLLTTLGLLGCVLLARLGLQL